MSVEEELEMKGSPFIVVEGLGMKLDISSFITLFTADNLTIEEWWNEETDLFVSILVSQSVGLVLGLKDEARQPVIKWGSNNEEQTFTGVVDKWLW